MDLFFEFKKHNGRQIWWKERGIRQKSSEFDYFIFEWFSLDSVGVEWKNSRDNKFGKSKRVNTADFAREKAIRGNEQW